MRHFVALLVFAIGCGGQGMPLEQSANAGAVIQYSVDAPYQISGASPAGSDGFVYSVLPTAPLAADKWQLTFCYQSTCFTLSQPTEWIGVGEVEPMTPTNATMTASGSVACSQWKSSGAVEWYDATPLHWHVALNVVCIDNSIAFRGDWQRI